MLFVAFRVIVIHFLARRDDEHAKTSWRARRGLIFYSAGPVFLLEIAELIIFVDLQVTTLEQYHIFAALQIRHTLMLVIVPFNLEAVDSIAASTRILPGLFRGVFDLLGSCSRVIHPSLAPTNQIINMEKLILHGHAASPNPLKIAIALRYLQISYEVKIWEFGDDPRRGVKGEDFANISPNGRVPALQDPNTGVLVWESGAIMNYLKRQYDKDGILGPRNPKPQDQADLEQWEYLLLTTLGPMTGQLVWFTYYNVQKNDDALQRYRKQVYRCYDVLEAQLLRSGGSNILSCGITSVDCHYEPWIRPAEYVGVELQAYPRIQKWLSFMAEQKPVKDGYQSIKDATASQDLASAERGLKPDESLLREIRLETS